MQGATVPRKPWISDEIIHALAGRIGLVTVAPFAALCGAVICTRRPTTHPAAVASMDNSIGPEK